MKNCEWVEIMQGFIKKKKKKIRRCTYNLSKYRYLIITQFRTDWIK